MGAAQGRLQTGGLSVVQESLLGSAAAETYPEADEALNAHHFPNPILAGSIDEQHHRRLSRVRQLAPRREVVHSSYGTVGNRTMFSHPFASAVTRAYCMGGSCVMSSETCGGGEGLEEVPA
jgi:hypothetical protein